MLPQEKPRSAASVRRRGRRSRNARRRLNSSHRWYSRQASTVDRLQQRPSQTKKIIAYLCEPRLRNGLPPAIPKATARNNPKRDATTARAFQLNGFAANSILTAE